MGHEQHSSVVRQGVGSEGSRLCLEKSKEYVRVIAEDIRRSMVDQSIKHR